MNATAVTVTATDIAKLKAAIAVMQRMVDDAEAEVPSGSLSRGPDGRHLDSDGVKELYEAFSKGMTPYKAHKHFKIAYRAARLRYDAWLASKAA